MTMVCAYHPEAGAVGACVNCGNLVCAECKIELQGKIHCNPCVDKMFAGEIEAPVGARKEQQAKQYVEVKAGFFPLAWFLFFCTPTIVVDGKAYRKSWGTHFFELEPGRHTIRIFFSYLFWSECGANSIDVTVEEGKTSRVKYFMPPWVLAKGSMKTEQPYLATQEPRGHMATQVGSYTEESEKLPTKRPVIGGVLSIIAGVIELILSITNPSWWLFYALLGIVAIVGGVFAIKRSIWGLALAGAICSLWIFLFGIPAIILIAKSKVEFK